MSDLERKEFLNKLWEGQTTGVEIEYNRWFETYDFAAFRAMAHGCQYNKNAESLEVLNTLIYALYRYPNATEFDSLEDLKKTIEASGAYPRFETMKDEEIIYYWNSRIKQSCLTIIKEIIYSASILAREKQVCKEIIKNYSESSDRNLRLYVACATNHPEKFLEDKDERIAKIASTRINFEEKWLKASDVEKNQIKFIKACLETDAIQFSDGLMFNCPDGLFYGRIISPLFKGEATAYVELDEDIIKNIPDKRLLASYINDLIKENKLTFDIGMLPRIFQKEQNQILKKKKDN